MEGSETRFLDQIVLNELKNFKNSDQGKILINLSSLGVWGKEFGGLGFRIYQVESNGPILKLTFFSSKGFSYKT